MKSRAGYAKALALICMSALLAAGGSLTVFAASKTISKVDIDVKIELEPGDDLPDLSYGSKGEGANVMVSDGAKYEIVEDPEWSSSVGSSGVKIGSTYTFKVILEAKDPDEYTFKGTYKSSNVKVSGGEFVSASRSGSDRLKVTIKTDPVEGTFEAPEEAEWSDTTLGLAKWDSVDRVDAYDITLYRGGSMVYKVKGYQGNKINFYPYMTSAGTYSFKVRSVAKNDSQKDYAKSSDWTDSDEIYIGKESVSDGSGKIDYNNQNSAGNNTTAQVGWIQQGDRWWYRYPDGSYQKNDWLLLNNQWFLFDADGWMLTDWQYKNNNWYYLNPVSDGNRGVMLTGWIQTNSGWYYLNPGPDGTVGAMYRNQWLDLNGKRYYLGDSGAMYEGWRQIGNDWYYFYPGSGELAVNTTIDTFYVDGNGIWRR